MSHPHNQSDTSAAPRISVVVPAFNEAENVENLALEIDQALSDLAYEMIFIDDASTDNTKSVLVEMKSRFPHLRQKTGVALWQWCQKTLIER